jgi:hypothetical protein
MRSAVSFRVRLSARISCRLGKVEADADAQEADSLVPTPKVKRTRRTSVQEPKSWRAPVALMY